MTKRDSGKPQKVEMEVQAGDNIPAVLKEAFARVKRGEYGEVVLYFFTPLRASGRFIITKQSKYDKHLAAFKRLVNGKGEFKEHRSDVVIGPR